MGWLIFIIAVLILNSIETLSQTSYPNEITAYRIDYNIKIDGILEEDCWQKAQRISNFTQRELNNGEPATEKTEVAVVFNSANLYIGVWCYDSEPNKIVANNMKRDFSYWTDDNFEILLDTYYDKRNGYIFVINPNGARADIMITNNSLGYNLDWNGVWDVATQINSEGWFAEIIIPFSTIKYAINEEKIWGINFERNIRRKRESVFWQGWSREFDFEHPSIAGKLIGIYDIEPSELLEVKPYITTGFQKNTDEKLYSKLKIGGDCNYFFSSNVRLNLTLNTDFAQVESDKMEINLTRFSIYYPEKRDFFLEGKNDFEFYLGHNVSAFYSRRIGIHNGKEIPIIGGARMLGKWNGSQLGILSMQTAETEDLLTTNYSVFRFRKDVLEKSYYGVILTAKNQHNHYNYTYGGEFQYMTSKFLEDKNLYIYAGFLQSQTKNQANKNNLSYRLAIHYPNEILRADLIFVTTQKDFNPEIGFLKRTNYKMINSALRWRPRNNWISWISNWNFTLLDATYYFKDDTRQLESAYLNWQPLGFITEKGESFRITFSRQFELLEDDFNILYDFIIPKGEYWFNSIGVNFSTFEGRDWVINLSASTGNYYNANSFSCYGYLKYNFSNQFFISSTYQYQQNKFANGKFHTNEIGIKSEYSFSPKLISSLYGQWNDVDKKILLNIRLHWIPVVGSDFYLAINQGISTLSNAIQFEETTILSKLVWRFSI